MYQCIFPSEPQLYSNPAPAPGNLNVPDLIFVPAIPNPYPGPLEPEDPAREMFSNPNMELIRGLRVESFICRGINRVTVCLSTMYDCCLLRPYDASETLIVVHVRRLPASLAIPFVKHSSMGDICAGKTWFVSIDQI